ncbi:MAG: multicopper oxidase domain-containing protein [Thermomicrobiales bacterium]
MLVRNELPQIETNQHLQARHTGPHDWTTMNLHTHGPRNVSPRGNSDNVFLSIAPGGSQQRNPPAHDHPAGFHRYHPHHHGAVAHQLRAGLAGAIIVRGDLDEVPEVAAAREQVMVLQAIELGDDFVLEEPIPDPTKEQAFFPRSKVLYTINGVLNPRITMYPGEVQRWRMVNAAEGKFVALVERARHERSRLGRSHASRARTVQRADDVSRKPVRSAREGGRAGCTTSMLTPGSSQKPNIPGMPDEHDFDETMRMTALVDMPGFP